MKIRTRWYLLALVLVVLAAVTPQMSTGWLRPPIAHAQLQDGSVVFVSDSIVGLVPGETARISVANPRRSGPLFFQCRVSDLNGVVLFESLRTAVLADAFRFQDIPRTALNVSGEPGTGRVQVSVTTLIFLPRNVDISKVVLSGEVLELSGQTKVNFNPPQPAMQRFADVPPSNF